MLHDQRIDWLLLLIGLLNLDEPADRVDAAAVLHVCFVHLNSHVEIRVSATSQLSVTNLLSPVATFIKLRFFFLFVKGFTFCL